MAINGSTDYAIGPWSEISKAIERSCNDRMMSERYSKYNGTITQAQEALRTAQRDLEAAKQEGRSGDWQRRRRDEILAFAADKIAKAKQQGRLAHIDDHLANAEPQFDRTVARMYTAVQVSQDIANMTDVEELQKYYRSQAGRVSAEVRQDYDRLIGAKAAQLGWSAADFKLMRRDFLSDGERLFEDRRDELERLGTALGSIEGEMDLALADLRNEGNTAADLPYLWSLYLRNVEPVE